MDPDAGVEMMIDAVMENNVIYSTIICDDDSTIRAVSKWSYKELLKLQPSFQWPRTLKGLKNHLFGCHDYRSETWFPVKAGKMVSNGKYHDIEKEKIYTNG